MRCHCCCQVTGIYRAMSVRVGQTQRTVKSIFKVRHFYLSHLLLYLTIVTFVSL